MHATLTKYHDRGGAMFALALSTPTEVLSVFAVDDDDTPDDIAGRVYSAMLEHGVADVEHQRLQLDVEHTEDAPPLAMRLRLTLARMGPPAAAPDVCPTCGAAVGCGKAAP